MSSSNTSTPRSQASTHCSDDAYSKERTPTTPPGIARTVSGISNASTSTSGGPSSVQWLPAAGEAVTGDVEGKTGRGRLASADQEAERELSSLYVTAERAALDHRALATDEEEQEEEGDDADDTEAPRQGWGGALVNGAVNAAVFSAAVGLTAYRLWSGGWGADKEGTVGENEADLPPAYDTVTQLSPTTPRANRGEPHGRASPHASSHSFRSSPPSTVGTASSPSLRRARKKRTQRPSIAALIAVAGRAQHPQQGAAPPSPVASVKTIVAPVSEVVAERQEPEPEADQGPAQVLSAETDSESDGEMNARLDEMSRRLQGLVTEAQRALSAKPSVSRSPSPEQPFSWTFTGDDGSVQADALSEGVPKERTLEPIGDEVDSVASLRPESSMSGASSTGTAGTFGSRVSLPTTFAGIASPTFGTFGLDSTTPPTDEPSSAASTPRKAESTRRSTTSTIPVPVRGRAPTPFQVPPGQSVPGARGPPPRARTNSTASQTSQRSTTSSTTPSGSYRGLPPLPWRRDPSGEVKWVQRPLSPAAKAEQALKDAEAARISASSTPAPLFTSSIPTAKGSPQKQLKPKPPLRVTTPPLRTPIAVLSPPPRTPTTPNSPRTTPGTPRTPGAGGSNPSSMNGTASSTPNRSRIPRFTAGHSRASSLANGVDLANGLNGRDSPRSPGPATPGSGSTSVGRAMGHRRPASVSASTSASTSGRPQTPVSVGRASAGALAARMAAWSAKVEEQGGGGHGAAGGVGRGTAASVGRPRAGTSGSVTGRPNPSARGGNGDNNIGIAL